MAQLMHKVSSVHPPNLGWLEVVLEDNEINFLWECIKNKKENAKYKLVGNITNSFDLVDSDNWFFKNVLDPLCRAYASEFKNLGNDVPLMSPHPYCLKGFWVNYQNQTEFNPLHSHHGIYSFVVWMKIPTNFKEQEKTTAAKSAKEQVVSCFKFHFINIVGEIIGHKYEMSPEMEGMMLFCPSKLNHIVYPYYECEEDRISISGNIFIDV